MKRISHHYIGIAATILVLGLNLAVLLYVGATWRMLAVSAAVQFIWTAGSYRALLAIAPVIRDKMAFLVIAYLFGAAVYAVLGQVLLHRGLFGGQPHLAGMASLLPFLVLAATLFFRSKNSATIFREKTSLPICVAVLILSCVLSALTAYGYANNDQSVRINDPGWVGTDIIPEWSFQSDRAVHFRRNTQPLYETGLPTSRANHKSFHALVVQIGSLGGEWDRFTALTAAKTLAVGLYFSIGYLLFFLAYRLLEFRKWPALVIALSALVFSPLKLPLLQLTPSYRGFFSAAGTMYHSDTQLLAIAISLGGLVLVLLSAKERHRTMALGSLVIALSFFAKPSSFVMMAPAIYGACLISFRHFSSDRALALGILASVPVLWLSYVALTADTSPLDRVFQGQDAEEVQVRALQLNPGWFEGYLPRLSGRFPAFIDHSPYLVALAMTFMSFAAFWFGWASAARRAFHQIAGKAFNPADHFHAHTHIYTLVGMAVFAIGVSVVFAEAFGHNMNWKWSAAAAYVMCVPLFARSIALIKTGWIRTVSWGVFSFQVAQGSGYLLYFFWNSRLV